jgi:glycerol-3-phosphate dehydrogenase (NAD(P)+)
MKVAVIGAGSWGTALANTLALSGNEVCMWARKTEVAHAITNEHRNSRYLSDVVLEPSIVATTSLEEAIHAAGAVVLVTPSSTLRDFAERMKGLVDPNTPIIVCSKGVEGATMYLPIEVLDEVLGNRDRLAVLSGPNHAEEVVLQMPSGTVIAAPSEKTAIFFRGLFSAPNFRCYTSSDYIGVELCAAFKNVIAIAVGISYGMGMGDNTAAMLMTRGMAEMSRLVYARGGDPLTVMGLAGAGDLIATCTSKHSRNRAFGQYVAQGKTLEQYESETHMVVEGAIACKTIEPLAHSYGVELPITKAVRSVVWDKASIEEVVMQLFDRPLTTEFWGLEHEGSTYAK